MEGRPQQEMDEILQFYKQIQLPSRLKHLGINRTLSDLEWNEIARISLLPEGTMSNMNFPVSAEMVVNAIKTVEAWSEN